MIGYRVGIFTPLNIYNGTTKGCPTRDLRATVTDEHIHLYDKNRR